MSEKQDAFTGMFLALVIFMRKSTIRYLNFSPSNGLKQFAEDLFSQLLEFAPVDANSRSTIENQEGFYLCKINVVSETGRFGTLVGSASPRLALQQGRITILKQISEWHQMRFLTAAFS